MFLTSDARRPVHKCVKVSDHRRLDSRGGDAPDFVEVGEAGIAMDDAMRRQRRVQLVG